MDTEFLDTITSESDRGCVLLAVSLLDESLKALLHTAFVDDPHVQREAVQPLFKGQIPPLRPFAITINLAYALGLIDRSTFATLHALREIRNEFSHRVAPAALTDDRVAQIVDRLSLPEQIRACIEQMADHYTGRIEVLEHQQLVQLTCEPGLSRQRMIFTTSVALLNATIISKTTHIRAECRTANPINSQ